MENKTFHFLKTNPITIIKEYNEKKPEYYVYTDGACSNNGKLNAKAGYGIYFGENDNRNTYKRIEGKQTNNIAEITAIIEAYYLIEDDISDNIPPSYFDHSTYDPLVDITIEGSDILCQRIKNLCIDYKDIFSPTV